MADVWQSPGRDLGCSAPHPEPRVAHGRSAHSLRIFAGRRGEGTEPEPGCGPPAVTLTWQRPPRVHHTCAGLKPVPYTLLSR